MTTKRYVNGDRLYASKFNSYLDQIDNLEKQVNYLKSLHPVPPTEWGKIEGDLTEQGDLTNYVNETVERGVKNIKPVIVHRAIPVRSRRLGFMNFGGQTGNQYFIQKGECVIFRNLFQEDIDLIETAFKNEIVNHYTITRSVKPGFYEALIRFNEKLMSYDSPHIFHADISISFSDFILNPSIIKKTITTVGNIKLQAPQDFEIVNGRVICIKEPSLVKETQPCVHNYSQFTHGRPDILNDRIITFNKHVLYDTRFKNLERGYIYYYRRKIRKYVRVGDKINIVFSVKKTVKRIGSSLSSRKMHGPPITAYPLARGRYKSKRFIKFRFYKYIELMV